MISFQVSASRRGRSWALLSVLLLLCLSLAGCNSGSGSTLSDGGGIGGTGISFGRITGFGSVIVNGTRFNTDNAEILVNGQPATQAQLSEGMLVRVEGNWSGNGQGVADRVSYADDIRGPVQQVVSFDSTTGSGEIRVLGQTVRFDAQTVFRGVTRDALAANQFLRISGWRQQDGALLASLVQSLGDFTDGGEVEIKGLIRDLDTGAQRFFIGDVEIDYSGAEIEMRGDRRTIAAGDEGAFVEVEGRFQGGVLRADEVDEEDDSNRFGARAGDDVEIEGPISSVDAAARTFVLHGVTVRITNRTEFDDLREADLQPGLLVEVEGEWNANGELVAEEIESRSADSSVEARLEAIDAGQRLLQVGGVAVQVSARTLIMDDDDDDDDVRLVFEDLRQGDYLEVDGIQRSVAGGGIALEALRIERDDDDDDFQLKGQVETIAANSFVVLGVEINVDGGTEWDDGLDDFDDLRVGHRVEIEYELRGGVYYAREVERDDD